MLSLFLLTEPLWFRTGRRLPGGRKAGEKTARESRRKDMAPHVAVLVAVLGIALLTPCPCKIIKHMDCGRGEVTSVDVVPCEEEPCMWKKNAMARMTATVMNSVDAVGGALTVTVDLAGIVVEYPGIEADICKKVACPIRKGQEYSISYDILVEDYFPEVGCRLLLSHYLLCDSCSCSATDGNRDEVGGGRNER